jgi:hypothetical protein
MEEDDDDGWQFGTLSGTFTGTFTGRYKMNRRTRQRRNNLNPDATMQSRQVVQLPGSSQESRRAIPLPGSRLYIPGEAPARLPTPIIDLQRLVQVGPDTPVVPHDFTLPRLPPEAWRETPAPEIPTAVQSTVPRALSPIQDLVLPTNYSFSDEQRRLEQRILGFENIFTSDDDKAFRRIQRQREHHLRGSNSSLSSSSSYSSRSEEGSSSDFIPSLDTQSSNVEAGNDVGEGQAEGDVVRGRYMPEVKLGGLSGPDDVIEAQPQPERSTLAAGNSKLGNLKARQRRKKRKSGFVSPGGDEDTEDPERVSLSSSRPIPPIPKTQSESLLSEAPHLTSRSDVTSSRSEVKVELKRETEERHQRCAEQRVQRRMKRLPGLPTHPVPTSKAALDLWKSCARCAERDFERTRSISSRTLLAIAQSHIDKLTRPV